MSTLNSLVLLKRIFGLKEGLPFILVSDTLLQSGKPLATEIASKSGAKCIVLSFETLTKPSYAETMIDCLGLSIAQIQQKVSEALPSGEPGAASKKTLLLVDSLNYIQPEELTKFVTSLILPTTVVLAVYHNDMVAESKSLPSYPSPLRLLTYIASSIFEVVPLNTNIDDDEIQNDLRTLRVPLSSDINASRFKAVLTNRRKSGRSLTYRFIIDTETHEYEVFKPEANQTLVEDESLLKDLTTFNLTTNLKQKLAKDQVELPYLQAQEELGSYSGAIVYEFEKDDDYDEEDPYEDPF